MFQRSFYSPKRKGQQGSLIPNDNHDHNNLDPLKELQLSITRLRELVLTLQRENDIITNFHEKEQQLMKKEERSGDHWSAESSPKKMSTKRKKPSYANMLRSNEMVHSYYLSISVAQEEELVELIRNIVDLVVKGEQRAAKKSDELQQQQQQHQEEEEESLLVLESFWEADALSVIANIATGQSFTTIVDTNSNEHSTQIQLFPPISVAIQIIQSVSILLTNLSKATSLYMILSNKKINDFIHFPIENYKMAEYNKTQDKKNSTTNKKVDISSIGEFSEMEAAYIMLLKSLCMRMNSETLQFYLQSPPLEEGTSTSSKAMATPGTLQFPLYTRALVYCDPEKDEFIRVTAMNICLNTIQLITKGNESLDTSTQQEEPMHHPSNLRPDQVKTPNASLHQSQPLPLKERLTLAQYICFPSRVESLTRGIFHRLAYLCSSLDDALRTMDQLDCRIREQHLSTATEHVTTHKTNVSKEQKHAVDPTLLDIDEESKLDDHKKRIEVSQIHKSRIVTTFQDIVADFQYEFMFLEDVLKVGLVPLNEQIMENMFAAVIYPLILTPIQLFSQHTSQRTFSDSNDSFATKGNPLHLSPFSKNLTQMKHLDQTITTNMMNAKKDSSLAKAALFVITIIFHHITHEQLLCLLATALLHPKTPVATDALVFNASPDVTFVDTDGRTYIRTDKLQGELGENFYRFGTTTPSSSSSQIGKGTENNSIGSTNERCNFIFMPALLYIHTWSETKVLPSSLEKNLRVNPFRRMILCCLAGTDGMVELQNMAVHVIDSIVSNLKSSIVKNVLLSDVADTEVSAGESSSSSHSTATDHDAPAISQIMSDLMICSLPNHVVEFITSLCVSVVTSFKSYRNCWCIQYNNAAAHAIYSLCSMEHTIQKFTLKLLDKRRQQSLSFLLQIPSRLDKQLSNTDKVVSMDENLMMDRMFFEPFCDGGTFVVESVIRDKRLSNNDLWDESGYMVVTKDERFDDVSKSTICNDISSISSFDDYDSEEEATYKCGANSIVAYLKIDSFLASLKGYADVQPIENQRGYMGVSTFAETLKECKEYIENGSRFLLAPLSNTFQKFLFDEEISHSINSNYKAGSIVSLVGKTAYPCVCEVKEENDSLFRDGGSYVVSDGIKWQSVYLVISGNYMMLTESVEGDSGGNGRVVIVTALSHLVAVYDETLKGNSISPARRLFLTHFSTEARPPGLFVLVEDETKDKSRDNTICPSNHVQMTKSILDVWFEDENAARKAHKSLSSKIFKARFKRGQRIKDVLIES